MRHRRALLLPAVGVVVALAGPGCDRAPAPASPASSQTTTDPAWLVDEAEPRGLAFTYRSGAGGRYHMPEIMGGGAALFDMDGDGDLDAYLVQGGRVQGGGADGPGNRLFRNRGDGSFDDVTAGSGADDRGYGMGVTCGDHDGDGDVDLYVTNYGRNTLLNNDGPGTDGIVRFRDVTEAAGVGGDAWSAGAAFLDHDRDGDLDLFVCAYLAWSPGVALGCFNTMGGPDYCSPRNFRAPAQDVLYRNDGRDPDDPRDGPVRFTDVTADAGLTAFSGTGLGVLAGDFTGDGWIDVFVANDGMRDQLWVNRGNGGFEEQSFAYGCAFDRDGRAAAGMGVTAADVDDDGDLDLLVCNLRNESDTFLRNEDGARFANLTAAAGLAGVGRAFTRFGMAWRDLDHDGRLDLYQATGRVMRQADVFGDDPYAEPNLLFRGLGDGRFEEVRPRGGTATLLAATSRAAAFGDVDGDGGIDILVVNRDAPAHLLMNRVPDRAPWIGFRVVETSGGPALGATLRGRAGDRTVTRDVRAASSYLAASDPRIHIGLAAAAELTDVTVTWADGATQAFGTFTAGVARARSKNVETSKRRNVETGAAIRMTSSDRRQ